MSQLDLFAARRAPLPPTGWAATSKAAAHSMRDHAPTVRDRVVAFIGAQGAFGATNEEIAEALSISLQSVCGRTNEAWTAEPPLIRQSNQRRAGRSGRLAKVWVRV